MGEAEAAARIMVDRISETSMRVIPSRLSAKQDDSRTASCGILLRLCDFLRVARYGSQIALNQRVGKPPLFPILQCPQFKIVAQRKFLLRHAESLPKCADINRRNADPRRCDAGRPQVARQPIAGLDCWYRYHGLPSLHHALDRTLGRDHLHASLRKGLDCRYRLDVRQI